MYNAGVRPKQILLGNRMYCSKMCLVDGIASEPMWNRAEKEWLTEKGVKWQAKIAAHYFNKRLKESNETVLEEKHSFGEMMRFVATSHV